LSTSPRPRPLLWDIYQEHLDEAAFLLGQWEDALNASNYTLPEVVSGPEERLLSHLDGLVLGGERVAKKLLFPALEGDDPTKVVVAAWALLHAEDADHFPQLEVALLSGKPETRDAVARAFELGVRSDLATRTKPLFDGADALGQAAVFDVLATRDAEWTRGHLFHALTSPEPRLVAAGLRAARRHPDSALFGHADQALSRQEPHVLNEALATAFFYGTGGLWTACRKAAATGNAAARLPLALLAIRGIGPNDPLFQTLLADANSRRHAIWALGFVGTVEAVDVLVSLLTDEDAGPVAGESISAITGVIVAGPLSVPGETKGADIVEVEKDDPVPEVRPEDDLLVPNAVAVAAWWQKVRARLDPAAPYLYGRPRTLEALRHAAVHGTTWRRAVYVLEIAAAERTGVSVDVRGWARAGGR
jgi:uncharacterized protein (TIGR02270 family)